MTEERKTELKSHGEVLNGTLDRIAELCLTALHIDGAHHKQWFLEEIAKIARPSAYAIACETEDWKKGIEP